MSERLSEKPNFSFRTEANSKYLAREQQHHHEPQFSARKVVWPEVTHMIRHEPCHKVPRSGK